MRTHQTCELRFRDGDNRCRPIDTYAQIVSWIDCEEIGAQPHKVAFAEFVQADGARVGVDCDKPNPSACDNADTISKFAVEQYGRAGSPLVTLGACTKVTKRICWKRRKG